MKSKVQGKENECEGDSVAATFDDAFVLSDVGDGRDEDERNHGENTASASADEEKQSRGRTVGELHCDEVVECVEEDVEKGEHDEENSTDVALITSRNADSR